MRARRTETATGGGTDELSVERSVPERRAVANFHLGETISRGCPLLEHVRLGAAQTRARPIAQRARRLDSHPAARRDSVVLRDGSVLWGHSIPEIKDHFVDVAPSPAFGRVVALDDGVLRGAEMLGGMLVS